MSADFKDALGKRIKGIVVKKNEEPYSSPAAQFFLVLDDDSIFEIYTQSGFGFSDLLGQGGMEKVRHYISPPMKIVCDISLAGDGTVEKRVSDGFFS